METFTLWPVRRSLRLAVRRRQRGMTLVETVVALGLLIVCGVGGMYAFMLLNRYAANERDLSAAKALCQERIEQVLTMPFRTATTSTSTPSLPAVLSQDGTTTYNVLGTAANYTTSGIYTGAETTSEPVVVYTQQGDTTITTAGATNSGGVIGTRSTSVTPCTMVDPATASVLGVVQFTVTVAYVFRGQSYSYSMATMRSPD